MDILGINNHMRFGLVHKWGIPLGLMAVLMGKGMPQLIFLKKNGGVGRVGWILDSWEVHNSENLLSPFKQIKGRFLATLLDI
jgi:hypothetical protein